MQSVLANAIEGRLRVDLGFARLKVSEIVSRN